MLLGKKQKNTYEPHGRGSPQFFFIKETSDAISSYSNKTNFRNILALLFPLSNLRFINSNYLYIVLTDGTAGAGLMRYVSAITRYCHSFGFGIGAGNVGRCCVGCVATALGTNAVHVSYFWGRIAVAVVQSCGCPRCSPAETEANCLHCRVAQSQM